MGKTYHVATRSLHQLVRPQLVIDSFTREPAPYAPPVPEPEVGARWGKPAQFEVGDRGNNRISFRVKDTERRYFENEIISLTEVHREFMTGEVIVHPQPVDADTADWDAWRGVASQTDNPEPEKITLEEIRFWTAKTGVTYETQRAKVEVFYRFETGRQLPFLEGAENSERGEAPGS